MKKNVVVVGSGIIGMSSALRLAQAGYRVEILTREPALQTTSAVASAFWYPYRVGKSSSMNAWAVETYSEFSAQTERGVPGVSFVRLRELFRDPPAEPWWADQVDGFKTLSSADLKGEFLCAYEYVVPFTDTPVYLPWLQEELQSLKVPTAVAEVSTLKELFADFDLIVNCSGVWAADLVEEDSVFPIRGQVQLVSPITSENPEILLFSDGGEVTCIVRRSQDCHLGVTIEEGDWRLLPEPMSAKAIRERCERLEPKLKEAQTLRDLVGLRPGRNKVRLEEQRYEPSDTPIIHNYGHAAAGYTLCWGCASEVVRIASVAVNTSAK